MAFTVIARLVQAKHSDGTFSHIYEGGVLPDDVDPEQLEQLIAAGMVEETPDPADGSEKPAKVKK